MPIICIRCNKPPAEIEEYREMAEISGMTPEGFVRSEEGTFNPETERFACTACYIAMGMPSSPTGWKA